MFGRVFDIIILYEFELFPAVDQYFLKLHPVLDFL